MKYEERIRKISKSLAIALGAFATAYVGTIAAMSWFLVRPHRRDEYDCIPCFHFGKLESIQLVTMDGVRLHAWVLRSRAAKPEDWVVILHGYRSDRAGSVNRARFFSRRGYNVLILHFRGHGSSQPKYISYGYHERKDVQAAFESIRSACPNASIGIVGISMGAAAASYAVGGGDVHPAWMILESCYDNIVHALANRLMLRVGNALTPLLTWPIKLIVEHIVELRVADLDPGKALENARCPILLMAGDSERVLKEVEIQYVYGCIQSPKRLLLFEGAGHEDFLAFCPRRYARAVESFLKELGPKSDAVSINPAAPGEIDQTGRREVFPVPALTNTSPA
jgi:uncharacterized protein